MPNKKFTPLKTKILLTLIPPVILFMLFCLVILKNGEQEALLESLGKRAENMAESLALMSVDSLTDPNNAPLANKLQNNVVRLGQQPGVVRLTVLNTNGKIKACTDQDLVGKLNQDTEVAQGLNSATLYKNSLNFQGKKCLISVFPVRRDENYVGVAAVYLSQAEINIMAAGLKRQLLGITLIAVAFAIFFVALLIHWYGNPLVAFCRAAYSMSRGQLELRANEERGDEVGLAGLCLNLLAKYVQSIVAQNREQAERNKDRVHNLRAFIDGVLAGETKNQAQVTDIDEIGQLAMGLNELVRHLRTIQAAEEALQSRIVASENALCPTIGDLQSSPLKPSTSKKSLYPSRIGRRNTRGMSRSSSVSFYKNRVLPDSDTVIAMQAPSPQDIPKEPQPLPPQQPPQQPEPPAESPKPELLKPELLNTDLQSSFIPIGGNFTFASDDQLSNSQVAYINSLNGLGVGQRALIATGGIEDSYPFLKDILEEEGFSVEYAGNTTQMLEMANSIDLQLVMIEFNETEGANQYAVNALRNLPQSSRFFIIVLEAAIQGVEAYNSMPNVIQIIIPNSDEELVAMIRESLAEILLTGNSFLAEGN